MQYLVTMLILLLDDIKRTYDAFFISGHRFSLDTQLEIQILK